MQPVYIDANAYFGGAEPFDREEHYVHVQENLPFEILDDGQAVYLQLHARPDMVTLQDVAMHTDRLPQVRIVQQDFENPDGTPLRVASEFLSQLTPGANKIQIWKR